MKGEFVFEPYVFEMWGKRLMIAKLMEPGTTNELLPHLENARIARVRRALLVNGVEVIARASKSKGERFNQTWICSAEPIAHEEWPALPRRGTGFDISDDDDDAT